MTGDPRAADRTRWGRIAIAITVFGLAAGLFFARGFGGSSDATTSTAQRDGATLHRDLAPASEADGFEPSALAENALPPILGEPRLDRIDLCDERNWALSSAWVREVRGDAIMVDEGAWRAAGASTRAGLASWASKCRLDGRPMIVLAEKTGREIGVYDPDLGYEALD